MLNNPKRIAFIKKHLSQLLIAKDALAAVIIMKLIIILLAYLLHIIESLNPIELSIKEINFLDLHYKRQNVAYVPESNNLVLINTGSLKYNSNKEFREEFTKAIGLINPDSPTVVGIDIEFQSITDLMVDAGLLTTLSSFPKLIMVESGPVNAIKPPKAEMSSIMIDEDILSIIRSFRLRKGDTSSFALAVAEAFKNEKLDHADTTILIDYLYNLKSLSDWRSDTVSRKVIHTIEAGEIVSHAGDSAYLQSLNAFISNKIILFGHLGRDSIANPYDSEDKHICPNEYNHIMSRTPNVPGILIQAQVIKMLLNNRRIHELRGGVKYITEFILIFIIALLFVYIAKRSLWFKPIAIPFSFILIFLIILFSLYLRENQVYWSVATLNIEIIILIEAVELYEPLAIWLNRKLKINSYFTYEKSY